MQLRSTPPPLSSPTPRDVQLRAAAEKLEAGFLAEMLRSAGVGAAPQDFGGGSGEDQFRSFLLDAQAEKMVQVGGIGLAQTLFDALKAQDRDA